MPSIEKRGKNSWRLIVEAGTKLVTDQEGITREIRDKRTKTVKVEDKALLRTTKKLQEHLEAEWYAFKTEVEAGTYIAPEKMTFREFTEKHYWPKYAEKKPGGLSESTQAIYLQNLKKHIYPHFEHKELSQIKTMHIVDFATYLRTPEARKDKKIEGNGEPLLLEPGTQRTVYKILHGILAKAVKWKVLGTNPCVGVEWPEKSEPDIRVYEEDEIEMILEALHHESDTWRMMILGTFFGGFRRGEMVAVELSDLNFDDDTLTIDENIPMKIKRQPLINPPKSKASRRTISMPHWYMEELAGYVREWKKGRLKAGAKWKGEDRQFLFHTGYGQPYHPQTPTNWWRSFLKKNGFRHVKLHGLRHTSATYLLENGMSLKAVSERLGHASSKSTEPYLHATKKAEKAAAQKFDRFQRRPSENRPQIVPNDK